MCDDDLLNDVEAEPETPRSVSVTTAKRLEQHRKQLGGDGDSLVVNSDVDVGVIAIDRYANRRRTVAVSNRVSDQVRDDL